MCGEIPPMAAPDDIKQIADRLIATREAMGLNQSEFAKTIGLTKSTYNPFEKKGRRITLDAALRMWKVHRIPLHWTYLGDPSDLPVKIYQKLGVKGAA